MDTESIGDDSSVNCPWCGEQQSIQDIFTDGCGKPEFEFYCDDCAGQIIIDDVFYSATVTVVRGKGTPLIVTKEID